MLTPFFFANPLTAWAGAPTGGPCTSRSLSGGRSFTLPISTARRRGVADGRVANGARRKRSSCRSAARLAANASAIGRSDFGGSSSVRSSTSRESGMGHRKSEPLARFVVGLGHGTCERADATDVRGAFGDGDGAARVEQIEGVRALQDHFVGRQHALRLDQALGFRFEFPEWRNSISAFESSKL